MVALRTRQEAAHSLASLLGTASVAGSLDLFRRATRLLVRLAEDEQGTQSEALSLKLVLSCITNLPLDVDKVAAPDGVGALIVRVLLSSDDLEMRSFALAAAYNRSASADVATQLAKAGCEAWLRA
eukprot:131831-Prymnesium_polylepis.1